MLFDIIFADILLPGFRRHCYLLARRQPQRQNVAVAASHVDFIYIRLFSRTARLPLMPLREAADDAGIIYKPYYMIFLATPSRF